MPVPHDSEQDNPPAQIEICQLSAGFLERVVLHEISLVIRPKRILGILGPAGVGKSTLLRTLSRWNELLPTFWCQGEVRLGGTNLLALPDRDEGQRALPLLAQKKHLYTASVRDNLFSALSEISHSGEEHVWQVLNSLGLWQDFEPLLSEPVVSLPIGTQRRIAIARMIIGGALCLLADEPLRDLSPEEEAEVRELLERVRSRCSVLVVTHSQRVARTLLDDVALLVAGRLIEHQPAEQFFEAPRTALAAEFIRSGNCWPTEAEMQSPEWHPRVRASIKEPLLPGGFCWILEGQLGGMRMPGLLSPIEDDLESLQRAGCKKLVNLRIKASDALEQLTEKGIENVHMPVVDMSVPSLEAALDLCQKIETWLQNGQTTVLHCKAGLGRTGTLLACFLVYRGRSGVAAIEELRSINPHYVQSEAQLDFIVAFDKSLSRGTVHGLLDSSGT